MTQESPIEEDPIALPEGAQGASIHTDREIGQLRAERDLLLERQRSIMELLGSTKPERILHDIRNILNERVLLRTLTGIEDEARRP